MVWGRLSICRHNRPARWINLWSRFDWISGHLDLYDRDGEHRDGANPQRVRNEIDPQASTPLQAHTEYWENAKLAETLWEELVR